MWRNGGASNDELVSNLVANGLILSDGDVVEKAMRGCDRALFVPLLQKKDSSSYEYGPWADAPQALGWKSTISAPWVQALALCESVEHVSRRENARILDVGSGSGIMIAYFCKMAKADAKVVGVEVVLQLVQSSRMNVEKCLGPSDNRWSIHHGDGWEGFAELGPFDLIHVGACAAEPPKALLDQLKIGGRLVIPIGKHHTDKQQLTVFDKIDDHAFHQRNVCDVRFVPLVRAGVDWDARYRKGWAYGKEPNSFLVDCVAKVVHVP